MGDQIKFKKRSSLFPGMKIGHIVKLIRIQPMNLKLWTIIAFDESGLPIIVPASVGTFSHTYKFEVKGLTGYNNLIKDLRAICLKYTNSKMVKLAWPLGANPTDITNDYVCANTCGWTCPEDKWLEKTIKQMKKANVSPFHKNVWLASREACKCDNGEMLVVKYLSEKDLDSFEIASHAVYMHNNHEIGVKESSLSCVVLPCLMLSEKIMINVKHPTWRVGIRSNPWIVEVED